MIRRRFLGQELRQLREAAGITPVAAAKALGVSTSSLYRIETGGQAIKEPYVRVMASMGGADDTKLEELLIMCEEAAQPEWYYALTRSSPPWFKRFLGLESNASDIRTYCVELVDGLLQTEEYARAIALAGQPDASQQDLERYLALRRGRQALLESATPPRLHVVINQLALVSNAGGREVMRGQVARLLELARLEHVTIQVLEFGSGAHPAMTSGFTLLGFDQTPELATGYIDVGRGAVYPDEPADLEQYAWKFDQLIERALTPAKTLELLARVGV
jgi:transcriptional regulator with XRE-family HTH domain